MHLAPIRPSVLTLPLLVSSLVLGAVAPAAAATAQDEATCLPARPAPGSTVDCWLPAPTGLEGPIRADVAGGYDDAEGFAVCRREGQELRCPDLAVFRPDDGGETVTADLVGIDGRRVVDALSVDLDLEDLGVRIRAAEHALVSPTRPWQYAIEGSRGDPIRARLVPRWTTEPVGEVELDTATSFAGPPAELGFDDLGVDRGVYRAVLCRGSGDACDPTGHSTVVQVGSTEVVPVDPDRADADRDRIDLVVATYGFVDPGRARETVDAMLQTGDPVLADLETGELLGTDEAEARVADGERIEVAFGPFAIDPLRQLRDRFNVWYLPTPLVAPDQLRHAPRDGWTPVHPDGFVTPQGTALDDVSVNAIALTPDGLEEPQSRAAENDIHEHPDITRDQLAFSGSTTWIPDTRPWTAATTLAHELGHALFGLRDEYPTPGGFPRPGYPNCAESREQAEAWWGDLEGELDPMADRYLEVLDRFTPDLVLSREQVEGWLTVDALRGGCTGQRDGDRAVYKPTERSLMNREIAVLGAVNRRRVERIVGLFSGDPVAEPTPTPSAGASPGTASVEADDERAAATDDTVATDGSGPTETATDGRVVVVVTSLALATLVLGGALARRRRRT